MSNSVKDFTVKGTYGCDYIISGINLVNAIEANFKEIARECIIGNASGYRLNKVTAKFKPGILGGKGGVELVIISTGMDLAHKPADGVEKVRKVWIYSEDKNFEHEFEIV